MAFLEIERLTKRYGATEVLKGIDLEIEEGGFLVLVGPSGCGKSTLLNTIAGLETVTGGEIRIAGRRVNELHPSKRDIAMVFQSYALYPNMTVAGNIAFGMEMRGVAKAERDAAIARVSEVLQIGHLLDRRPSQLSGGQRQRVAMGRALVRNPQVFLFDEPLSNLDAKLRIDMRTEIKRLHQAMGTTIVYVTHDQIEAMTLGHPHRRAEGRRAAAIRHAGGDLQRAGQCLRRRFHGLAGHEPRAGQGPAGGQPLAGRPHPRRRARSPARASRARPCASPPRAATS